MILLHINSCAFNQNRYNDRALSHEFDNIFFKDSFVKKLLQKIWSQKKLGIAVIVILLVIICSSIYTLIGVRDNVKKMAEVPEVTFYPDYPRLNTEGKNAEVIKRGEYLVKAGD